jgi:hypothetical protein
VVGKREEEKITITDCRLKKWKGRLSGKERDTSEIEKVREGGATDILSRLLRMVEMTDPHIFDLLAKP